MLTLKTINFWLYPHQVELHKGNGYYYFVSEKHNFKNSMVMVNSLNSLSLSQWVQEAYDKILEAEEN